MKFKIFVGLQKVQSTNSISSKRKINTKLTQLKERILQLVLTEEGLVDSQMPWNTILFFWESNNDGDFVKMVGLWFVFIEDFLGSCWRQKSLVFLVCYVCPTLFVTVTRCGEGWCRGPNVTWHAEDPGPRERDQRRSSHPESGRVAPTHTWELTTDTLNRALVRIINCCCDTLSSVWLMIQLIMVATKMSWNDLKL